MNKEYLQIAVFIENFFLKLFFAKKQKIKRLAVEQAPQLTQTRSLIQRQKHYKLVLEDRPLQRLLTMKRLTSQLKKNIPHTL